MKTKILIVEHDSNDMELIQQELKKGSVNFIAEIVHTKKEYEKAIHNFKPDIILSNYTFPSFDGSAAFKIKEKLAPQTPFIFVSESIGEENAIEFIRSGVTDFVLKERLSTLTTKVNRALKEAALSNLNAEQKQSEEKRMEELCRNESKYASLVESSMDAILLTVKDGQILAANTAACEIFKMTQDEICNSGRFDIVDHTDLRLQPLLEERHRTGKAKGEITFKRKDGSRFPGEITSVVFTDTSGQEKTSMTIRDITEKKTLEKSFEVERKRFMDLYLQAPSSMGILKGPNHVYEMVNPLYLKLIGRNNVIGKTVKEVLPEVESQGVLEFLDKVYLTGETFFANEKLIQFDHDKEGTGKLVDTYLNFICQAHKNNKGEIDGIFFFAIDVTEQVLSRKKIEESEKRFRALIEKSEEMIMLTSAEGKLLYGSPSISKIFGYSEEDVALKNILELIHPDDLTEFIKKRTKLVTTPGKSFYYQQRVRHKNGNWIWCENTITNLLHEPGINALVTNFRDITEKKLTEEQMEFDQYNLNALINNTDDLMWSVNKDYTLITSNKPFDEMTRHTSGKTIPKGSNILTGITPEEIIFFKNNYKRAFTGETFTEIICSGSPDETWSEISYYPIRKGNEIIGTACHSRNITERKKARLNLEQRNIELVKTNSELDRFVYSVSHDLRSPLTSILGLLSFIEDESKEGDTLEHVGMIRNSINRLDEFIKNILSYSRNNRTTMEVEKIALQEGITEIVNSLHSMKEAEGILFEIDIQEQQSFYSDRMRFNTILENLISNAIKYHRKDKTNRYIKIAGQSDHEKLQLTIADNGIGIEPAHHNKIFDMFFRLSGKTDGSGIGLYIVKNTVEKMKGTIQVESELGIGTTFIITLKNLKS
ncbi:PAS domain S-box protein [Flavobacterium sp.]|uniref:PAS domain S-box protein n=1 Tax=Flavobacterium sp. TaxID=239 RepID=UPI002B4B393A|nr:PAS domain S-box protein [Flavobacterium sp.]HLF52586.1 PAS domain S-box protein [Flavobacterium sp.]